MNHSLRRISLRVNAVRMLSTTSLACAPLLLPSTVRLYSSLSRPNSSSSPVGCTSLSLSHGTPRRYSPLLTLESSPLRITASATRELSRPNAFSPEASSGDVFSPFRPYSATYEPAIYSLSASIPNSEVNATAAAALPLSVPYVFSSLPQQPIVHHTSPEEDDRSPKSLLRQHIFPYLPLGMAAGFIGSLTGVGGALVIAPLLQMFLSPTAGLTRASQISGTALMTCAAGSFTGSITCLLHGAVDFGAALTMGITAAALLPIGAKFNTILPEYWLQRILAVAFLFFAPLVLLKNYAMSHEHEEEKKKKKKKRRNSSSAKDKVKSSAADDGEIVSFDSAMAKAVKDVEKYFRKPDPNAAHQISAGSFVALGSVVGLINGLVGFGGGLLSCTTLSLTQGSLHDMSHSMVLGTSLTMLFFPSLVGAVLHFRKGNFVAAQHLVSKVAASTRLSPYQKTLRYVPLLSILSGAAIGAVGGADVAVQWLPEEFGRYFLGLFLIATGLRQFTRLRSLSRK